MKEEVFEKAQKIHNELKEVRVALGRIGKTSDEFSIYISPQDVSITSSDIADAGFLQTRIVENIRDYLTKREAELQSMFDKL